MSWAKSLIRLSTYEAEVLQKRLAEVVDRRMAAEMKLMMLEAEGEAQRAGGEAQETWGKVKRGVSDAVDGIGEAISNTGKKIND